MNPETLDTFLQTCEQVARLGGQKLMELRSNFSTSQKATNDLVTDADFASQQVVHDAIAAKFPDHRFLGEEQIDLALVNNVDSPFQWIVDPLDGTMNYVHQLPSFSVSVALQHNGKLIVGAVYDPWLDELYSASCETPAHLNGKPIRVSGCDAMDQALAVVSLPSKFVKDSAEAIALLEILTACRSVRRLGSAALNLCYVATGRIDAYWASRLSAWDVAAGVLILQQAGGHVVGSDGAPFRLEQPHLIAASGEPLCGQLTRLIN